MFECTIFPEYHWHDQCRVQTCKFWTGVTEHRCLEIDREHTSSSTISDIEIRYFKRMESKASVVQEKRMAEDRIKNLLVLDGYIKFITLRYVPDDWYHPYVETWLRCPPFSYELWNTDVLRKNFSKIVAPDVFSRFCSKLHVDRPVQHEILQIPEEIHAEIVECL